MTKDNAYVVTASRSLSLQIYQRPDMTLVRTIAKAHEAPVALMATDPTSSLLATGSADGSVKVWDLAGGYCTHVFRGHGGVISALCWNVQAQQPGSSARTVQLLTGCVDGKVRVWDLQGSGQAASKPTAVLSAHAGVVRAIGVAPGGRTIVSGARDQTLVFWDWKDGRWHRRDIVLAQERIEALGFVGDASPLFYTAGSQGLLRLWDVRNGQEVHKTQVLEPVEEEDALHGLTDALYAPSCNAIVTVSATQDMAFYALGDGTLTLERQLVGYNDEVVDVALVGDDTLAVASNNTQLRLYKLDTQDHDVVLVDGHRDMVLSLDTSPDRAWLASGSKDRTARIWARASNARDGWVCLGVCEGHAESVGSVAFARQSSTAGAPFLVTASQDRTVKLWDLTALTSASRQERLSSLLTLKIHDKDINAIDLAPNNGLLVSGSQDRTARVFRLHYQAPSKANQHRAAASLEPLATCKGHKRGVWSVQFSPAEQAFATASSDQTVRLWSLKDFSCVRVFEGHTGSVLRLRFLPGGAQIASSGNDGLVKVWNVRDEECAATIDAHEDKIWALAVRPETADAPLQIVSGAADSTITLWNDTTAAVESEKAVAAKEATEREQAFSNLLVLKDYRNAIALAFQLNQPRRLLQLFTQVAASRPDHDAIESMDRLLADALGVQRHTDAELGSITGLAAVDRIIAELPRTQVVQLLGYVRDWNTSARTSATAQLVLHAVLRQWEADTLLEAFDEARRTKKEGFVSMAAMLEALLPYTERHYARVDRMLVESAMLDYTLQAMDGVLGFGADAEDREAVDDVEMAEAAAPEADESEEK